MEHNKTACAINIAADIFAQQCMLVISINLHLERHMLKSIEYAVNRRILTTI